LKDNGPDTGREAQHE